MARVAADMNNPAKLIFNRGLSAVEHLFDAKPKAIKTFGLRMRPIWEAIDFPWVNIEEHHNPEVPPWVCTRPSVDYKFLEFDKKVTPPIVIITEFLQHCASVYCDYCYIYTDGSKVGPLTGAAAVMDGQCKLSRLRNNSSVYSAELNGFILAFDLVEEVDWDKFVIFSDSLSALQSIANNKWKHPLVQTVLERNHYIHSSTRKKVVFCWIPSHVGIKGNEMADRKAKEALQGDVLRGATNTCFDFKQVINEYVYKQWQLQWDMQDMNKLHFIQPKLGLWTHGSRKSRREEILLSCIRIGHTYLTHSFLLKSEQPPECVPCECPLTVKHIMIECDEFSNVRRQYFRVSSMKELFDNVDPTFILQYIYEIGLFYKL